MRDRAIHLEEDDMDDIAENPLPFILGRRLPLQLQLAILDRDFTANGLILMFL